MPEYLANVIAEIIIAFACIGVVSLGLWLAGRWRKARHCERVPEADPLRKAIASLSVPAVGTPIHITDLTSGPPLEYHGVVTEELREALLTTPPECVGGIVGIDSTPEDIAELLALGRSETDGTQKLGGGKVATDRGKEDMSAESEQDPLGTEKGPSLISGQISVMSLLWVCFCQAPFSIVPLWLQW